MDNQNEALITENVKTGTQNSSGCVLKSIKWFLIIMGVIAAIIVGIIALTDETSPLFSGDDAYIDMVKECYAPALGTTYGELFDNARNAQWSYFETEDGRQIVELNAENNGEKACIQFELTKESGNNYWIEPIYTDINGTSINPTLFFAALIS